MLKEAVLHIPDSNYAFAIDENTIIFRLRTKKDDIKRCTLCYGDRVCPQKVVPMEHEQMEKVGTDALFDYYECKFTPGYTRIFYYFILEDGTEKAYYYANEFHESAKCDRTEYYQYAYIRREEVAQVPSWAPSAVIYQIFPDSFATSKRFISRKGAVKNEKNGLPCFSKNGGTLKGITENLDYLVDLGITCIYLNPIFTASSYHKYDTIDYFSIDPCFGTKDDLKGLVSACHKNGIRVILDGVFNHCGTGFFAFQDVVKNGAKSKYVNWFYNISFPTQGGAGPDYETFAYVREMPKLNTGNPETAEYLCNVGTYWIREADIDGWRLDVANEINHGFWRRFRESIKKVKPNALLIGEIWEDAPQWLEGDQLDSTMNYRFSNLCRDFFAERKISAKQFDQELHSMVLRYKSPMTYVQMNLLDSHDVPRFFSKCGENPAKYELALFFMMTFIGIPSIFYGDEAGITGVIESDCRKAMAWENHPDKGKLFCFFKKLIAVRKQNDALVHGNFKTISANDKLYIFSRSTKMEKLLVVLNNSDVPKKLKIPQNTSKRIDLVFDYGDIRDSHGHFGKINEIGALEGKIFKII
ncbi:MAG TPA: alpha-glycosidase [Ruminococcaceae bacterium]|nr:alpha-glycosidase [Oscillospiraceae bacterium]